MVDIPTRKERYMMHNSLVCLMHAIKDEYVTIEMRNGNAVSGKLSHVDGYMNMAMDDAVLVTADDKQHIFEYFYLQARNIKYVTIPQHMDVAETIMHQLTHFQKRFCQRKQDVRVKTKFGKPIRNKGETQQGAAATDKGSESTSAS